MNKLEIISRLCEVRDELKNYRYGAFEHEIKLIDKCIEEIEQEFSIEKKLCPDCGGILEYKMHDMDGTNLEEFLTCPDCKYIEKD